jgi:predicted PhzF superfamily epimerase YddE/YHI9
LKKSKKEKYAIEIRWFSPITEIDFCGHATLATAFVLFEENSSLNVKLIF